MEETTSLDTRDSTKEIQEEFSQVGKTILYYIFLQFVSAFLITFLLIEEHLSLLQICTALLTLLISYLTLRRGMKKQHLSKLDLHIKKSHYTAMTTFSYLMVGMGVSMLGSIVVVIINTLISSLQGIVFVGPDFSMHGDFIYDISMIFMVLVIAPIFEELIFRGVILRTLLRYHTTFAILVSGVLFGMMHMNLVQGIPTMLFGIVLGYVCVKSDSILPCIIIHFLNNFISLLAGYVLSNELLLAAFALLQIIFMVYAIVYVFKRRGRIMDMLHEKMAHPYYKLFFSSWSMIIFLAIVILYTLTSFVPA